MARDHARIYTADFTLPCPGEIAKLAQRYKRTRGGNLSRTWRPSKQRMAVVRALVFERDGFACRGCGFRPEGAPEETYTLELDHVMPYRKGGLFYPENLQTLCRSCNLRKGARV